LHDREERCARLNSVFAPFATVSLSLDLLGRVHDREERCARLIWAADSPFFSVQPLLETAPPVGSWGRVRAAKIYISQIRCLSEKFKHPIQMA
jgi:hypothetical protein